MNLCLKMSIEYCRGKRQAKALAKEAKRSRLAADNNLSSISFSEKEDLALFLLKGSS